MVFSGIKFSEEFQPSNEKKVFEKKCKNIDEMIKFYVDKIKKIFMRYEEEEVILKDGSINMGNYMRKRNGPYKKEDIKNDKRFKDIKMRDWAKDFYELDDNVDDNVLQEKTKEYREIKKFGNGQKLENFLFVNLNRILAPDYFVMHASEYDDLSNGVDFVVVETDTGIVAAGFDSVYDEKGGDRYKIKVKKLRKQSERYGAKLKYGFIFEEGKMIKKQLINLPNFFLNINFDDIKKLEKDMNYAVGDGQKPSDRELEIFDKLIISLEEQLYDFNQNKDINPKVEENLKVFSLVLTNIKKNRAVL